MKELITRITAESPTFFKKIQAIGIAVGVIGGAILALPASLVALQDFVTTSTGYMVAIPASLIVLPTFVTTVAGYMVAIGSVAAAVAKTTVADPTVLQKKDEGK